MGGAARARRAPQDAWSAAAPARWAPLALGVLGALLILLREANFGVGLTWDSGSYLSVARNLVAGNGLLEWNGTRYQGAAPLFPLLLAAVGLFGVDAAAAAGSVNAAAFGLTVFAVTVWLQRHVRAPLLAVWAGCACALSPALAPAAAHAWNEIVFILFVVVSLSLLDRFLSAGKLPALLLAAVAAAAASLTRYLGVTLIGAGALIILLRNDAAVRTRIRDAAIWSAASTALFGAWLVRNIFVLGSVFGNNFPNGFSALVSLHNLTGELALWLLGQTGSHLLNAALGGAAGVDAATLPAVAANAVMLILPTMGIGYALARSRPGFLPAHRTVLTVTLVFTAVYVLFLAIFLPLGDTTLPGRYLLPIFPPLLIAATLALDRIMSHARARSAPGVVSVVMSLWLVWQAGANYYDIRQWLEDGAGYTAREWTESDVIRYLNDNRLTGAWWSSDPQALYFHTDIRARTIAMSLATVKDQLANRDPAESTYVVLFDLSFLYRYYDYDYDDLAKLLEMEPVADLEDGAIFRIVATEASEMTVPSGALLAEAEFDIHLLGRTLTYFKEPCAAEDLTARFFLHVFPAEAADQAGYDNLNFWFHDRGAIRNGRCAAVVPLPDYRIGRITSGQYVPGEGQLWGVEIIGYQLRPAAYRRVSESIRAGAYGAPAARSNFDLYLAEGALTYFRQPCTAEEVDERFFLHVVPTDLADLPPALRRLQWRFENLDFRFSERGNLLDGTCVAVVPLPDYQIARIRTGQYIPEQGHLWDVTFSP